MNQVADQLRVNPRFCRFHGEPGEEQPRADKPEWEPDAPSRVQTPDSIVSLFVLSHTHNRFSNDAFFPRHWTMTTPCGRAGRFTCSRLCSAPSDRRFLLSITSSTETGSRASHPLTLTSDGSATWRENSLRSTSWIRVGCHVLQTPRS